MLKRFLRSKGFQAFVGRRIAGWMKLCEHTTRWEYLGRDSIQRTWASGAPVMMAFWHGRIMLAPHGWPPDAGQPPLMLISQSSEGEIIAQACEGVGVATIRGSTMKKGRDKGGAAAFRGMVRHARGGGCAIITPDGPKGPRMRATLGAIKLAQTAGCGIVAMTWSTRRGFTMDSWDRFVIPMPWGRGIMAWSDPLPMPGRDATEDEVEAARRLLEDTLNDLTARCDAAMGRRPVEPAPPAASETGADDPGEPDAATPAPPAPARPTAGAAA
jgi:lysophospholipid acyltransferase (LPLAT)-like uncharacterized protein